ncbi:hypothetical protein CPB85DRAFT_758682 [Mucidula mucida]|nr:hypothetical protein CPB85DRAFT_758682 [Mucidula mucida]
MHDVVWDYRCPLDEVLSIGWMTMFPARSQMRDWISCFLVLLEGLVCYACHWLAVGMTWTWTPLWRGAASILHWSITGTFPDIYAYYLDRRIAIHYLYYIVSLRFLSSWCYTLSLLGPFSVHSNFTRPPTEQSFRIHVSAGSDVCVSSDSWRSWVCK